MARKGNELNHFIKMDNFYFYFIAAKVLAHPEANKYVAGIAVHWYGDIVSSPGILTTTHEMFPDRFIFGTEACEGLL